MIKKFLLAVLVVISGISFSVVPVGNPADFYVSGKAFGIGFLNYFGKDWLMAFDLYYLDNENGMSGKLYLSTASETSLRLNVLGYQISGQGESIDWGINTKINNFVTDSTSTYSVSFSIGVISHVGRYLNVGVFVDDFFLYSQTPKDFFTTNAGVSISAGVDTFNLYGEAVLIRQQYVQIKAGAKLAFQNFSFGVFWTPEYVLSNGEMSQQVSGYVVAKFGSLKMRFDAHYAFNELTTSLELPINFELYTHGYKVTVEINF
ncbi:hypothetical protein JYK00_09065 [Thermosipho ferrireducens]|uniref:Uncharacterized protein n=1 Tax=Thermosipho ferrireducens TaxID=2571116 RepID=A0ABX7S5M5_9BACT|nr:hypothetical protein [Thermosipho ferrireducens]QTA37857.1 hypothetical protein JYK00_09065 [Thermosipho ferrireducens]